MQPEVSLADLASMSRDELAARWEGVFDCPAPKRSHAPMLLGALSWHLQMQARNPGPVSRLLRQSKVPSAGSALSPGTTLVREWQGQVHRVTVLDAGFEYAGKPYRSLSAIARLITGTPWSGPLFFGLK